MDSVLLGQIKSSLDAASREMAVNLQRSAVSSIVREAADFSVALMDARGEVVSQAECIPIMTAGIALAAEGLGKDIDIATLKPGDALFMNDPYNGGQHLQDIYLFTPVFYRGELVGFSGCTAHHVDIGGSHAGLSAKATELYQEGLQLPLARFNAERDFHRHDGFVRRFIEANVRVPDAVMGDLRAQFAANDTGARRLLELVERFGLSDALRGMGALKDYAEARTRYAIEDIPDGVYEATDVVDASPWGRDYITIHATVRVHGSNVSVDFDGTGDQVDGNINCPFASTVSAVQSALRCMLPDDDLLFNEGANRPLTVSAPLGSILNPRHPAAVRARLTPASRAFDVVVRALGEAVPERAVATGFNTTSAIALSSHVEGEGYEVTMEILGGGWGGTQHRDGAEGLDNPISNCANAPIEALETDYSGFRVIEYSFLEGSAGQGRSVGGRGIRRVYEAVRDGVKVAGYADRHRVGAPGHAGGDVGGVGAFYIERATGEVVRLLSVYEAVLARGDRLVIETGGGGGYGPASEADEVKVGAS